MSRRAFHHKCHGLIAPGIAVQVRTPRNLQTKGRSSGADGEAAPAGLNFGPAESESQRRSFAGRVRRSCLRTEFITKVSGDVFSGRGDAWRGR
jgi:hypothetical protein